MASAKEQFEFLTSEAAEVVPRNELLTKLERAERKGRPLRAKLGIDPSRPDLTLGHTVVLRKLRQFQDLGHTAVLIIGDFTGLVGDPSGQSETRPMLTSEEMETNARTYFEQAGLVVDVERAEVRHNSEWLGSLSMADVLRLTATTTVAQMLERDDFQARYREGRPISIVEFLYPLMQGMDSVKVQADVELGGTDQKFNLLLGRELQRAYGQEPQVVLTMPLLIGTDGQKKMSKSLDNYVALADPPDEMFGKLMSVPDQLVPQYLALLTDLGREEVAAAEEAIGSGGPAAAVAKRSLARELVDMYHGAGTGDEAGRRFDLVHRQHELPDDVPERALPATAVENGRVWLPRLLAELGLVGSNSEGRRMIEQGAVRLDGEMIEDPATELTPEALAGRILQVGRRRFVRIGSRAPRSAP
jgi:tyrosyl-tRNA synthetase